MPNLTDPPRPQRTILLRGKFNQVATEGRVKTGGSIMPGMLVEMTTTTPYQYPTLQAHATSGGHSRRWVALEGMVADIPYQTFTGGTIDDAYAAGALLRVHECMPHDVMYMLIPNAANITINGALASNGDGTLKAWA